MPVIKNEQGIFVEKTTLIKVSSKFKEIELAEAQALLESLPQKIKDLEEELNLIKELEQQ